MSRNNHDHPLSLMEEINASEMPAKRKGASGGSSKKMTIWPKSDARYWQEGKRMFKNHDSPEYSCRFTKLKRREHFSLGSAHKKIAAAKAAEIYSCLQAHGWDATLEKYRPTASETEQQPVVLTVGTFIEAACRISSARPESTLNAYTKAFRLIVSEIKEIGSKRKFDSSGGGSLEWRNKVDAVELASIKPTHVVIWKNDRLNSAENPLEKMHASVTVNSLMRNAKSLFGKKILPFLEQDLPLARPLPFDGVPFEEKNSMRYNSKMDPYGILAKAKEEMLDSDPEAFKVVILALICGLRRSEIDNLLWKAFNFTASKLSVEPSVYHGLKSKNSSGDIDLDADTLALFLSDREKHLNSIFVIESRKLPKKSKTRKYRCDEVFERVLAWLRAKGVESTKPIHTLRKEIGSLINKEYGIYAASRFLRHSNIGITAEYYLDNKETVVPKTLGKLLRKTELESGGSAEPAGAEPNDDPSSDW